MVCENHTRTPILTESGCIDSEMEADPGKAKIKYFLVRQRKQQRGDSFTKQIINSTSIYTEELFDLLESYFNFLLAHAKGKINYLSVNLKWKNLSL